MRGEGGGDVTRALQCSVLAVKVPDAQSFQAKPWGTGLLCDPAPLQTPSSCLSGPGFHCQTLNAGLCEPVLPKLKTAALSLPFPPQELSPVGEGREDGQAVPLLRPAWAVTPGGREARAGAKPAHSPGQSPMLGSSWRLLLWGTGLNWAIQAPTY